MEFVLACLAVVGIALGILLGLAFLENHLAETRLRRELADQARAELAKTHGWERLAAPEDDRDGT